MKKDRLLALRIVEVREAYSREGFEWDSLKKAAIQEVEAANIKSECLPSWSLPTPPPNPPNSLSLSLSLALTRVALHSLVSFSAVLREGAESMLGDV